jgi:4-amino-4-deoxy-L-arabinose transferase-like glycosyltransferase
MAQAEGVLTRLGGSAAIFGIALGVRLAYLLWQGTGPADTFHPDTPMFLAIAVSPDWWSGTSERLPGYPIFLALHFAAFGAEAYWAPLVSQCALDALACVAIARTAERVRPGAGAWAGILATLNPTQIVMAAVLLGDSLFVSCLAFGFLALARWWRGEGGPAAVGVWFGLALVNRAVLWPFLPILGLAMVWAGARRGAWRAAPVALGIVTLFAAPIVAWNWVESGKVALSSQGPTHVALWWYPLVKEAHDGTPYALSVEEASAAFRAAGGGAGGFADADIYDAIARQRLAQLPPQAFAKAWAMGAAINLASPATLMIPRAMWLPRTGFYATQGESPVLKVRNFLTQSSSASYLAWLAGGVALEWPVRFLAFAGLLAGLASRAARPAALFAVAWVGFVLVVQGPVASAKYRLPIEPLAMVFAGYALALWRARGTAAQ